LQNQGRYYIAKIVDPPGKVVARLLVDKLNNFVHFPKNNLKLFFYSLQEILGDS